MKTAFLATLLMAGAALAPLPAAATTIASTYAPLGSNNWLASFVVRNDGLPSTVGGFTVYFAPSTYTALALVASPAGWDSIVVQPDLALPSAGFLDALALTSGAAIASNASLGGFQVGFKYTGAGLPGALNFVVNDANFNVLFSGMTSVTAVPEPASWALTSVGLALFASVARRRAKPGTTATTAQEQFA